MLSPMRYFMSFMKEYLLKMIKNFEKKLLLILRFTVVHNVCNIGVVSKQVVGGHCEDLVLPVHGRLRTAGFEVFLPDELELFF